MTDPPRLLDATRNPFERAILGSARRDNIAHRKAHLRSLALVSAAAAVATQTGTAAAIGGTATMTALAVKGLLIGMALGATVQGAVVAQEHLVSSATVSPAHWHAPMPPKVATATVPHLAATGSPIATFEALPETEEPPKADLLPTVRAPGAVRAPSAVPTIKLAPSPDDSLEREVRLLDEARARCSSGNYAQAIAYLDRYQQQFRAGALGPEALVIRVQALIGQGRRSEALALAKPFIATSPHSPVAKRLDSLLRLDEGGP